MMLRFLPLVAALILSSLYSVSATALTYKLQPNEKACFFSFAEQKGQKLAFYFAVSLDSLPASALDTCALLD